MRPVERGPRPNDPSTGLGRIFDEYGHARPYLIHQMGDYCSFCEMQLPAALAVEHIQHKDGKPGLEREWENFLLACPSCNSTKGTKVGTLEEAQGGMGQGHPGSRGSPRARHPGATQANARPRPSHRLLVRVDDRLS